MVDVAVRLVLHFAQRLHSATLFCRTLQTHIVEDGNYRCRIGFTPGLQTTLQSDSPHLATHIPTKFVLICAALGLTHNPHTKVDKQTKTKTQHTTHGLACVAGLINFDPLTHPSPPFCTKIGLKPACPEVQEVRKHGDSVYESRPSKADIRF
jgi:hypothetical protein